MTIEGKITVKFRKWGITFGTATIKTFSAPVPNYDATIYTLNENGVTLSLRTANTGVKS